uniref:Putative reverse transcriptase domain-containing protein n=1 Tax=Tanacetum cinerariifolium TaxID=118510 RepID=A0A6L2NKZ9_TANCI|nr:putative reverse transcriptase domain-containing protein [Tanacetum cinerariifolium]
MTNSGHSTVSYTLISSPERSWDIPDVDPYEEAALHAIEQVAPPLSPAYLSDPIKLGEHVLVYVLEPKYPEYHEPPADDIFAEDKPHADDVVPMALSSGYITDSDPEEDLKEDPEEDHEEEENPDYANEPEEEDPEEEDHEEEDPEEEESDDNAASEKEPSEGSNDTEPSEEDETAVTPPPSRLCGVRISIRPQTPMPPLFKARVANYLLCLHHHHLHLLQLPIETHAPEQDVAAALLMLPSTTHRSEVPEADMPPRKRLCFATPITEFEVRESLAAAAARSPKDLYGFIDTTKAEVSITRRHAKTLHDTEHRMMTTVDLVNLRVSYEAQTRQRDGEEFHLQLRDAQRDRASIRAEIMALRDRGTRLEDAYIELYEDLLRSEAHNESLEAHNRSLVARIETIKTRMTKMEDQFQDTRDHAFYRKIVPATRQGTSNNMTPEAIQAMINQAMQRNLTNGDGSHSSGGGPTRPVQSVRACSYFDFMKYQPLNFRGTEGVFVTCTMLDDALTWWNGHVRTLGHDAAYVMTWETLKKKLTDKYCPKELALMCTKFLADETEKVDKYISGLPDNIYGNVMSTRPKTLDKAIELANDLMDQKPHTYVERQNDNKRKADDSSRNNQQQQPHKKQNVARAYTTDPGEKKAYTGNLPLCTKCNYHHTRQCVPKCNNCKKYGHATRNCRVNVNSNNNNNNNNNNNKNNRVKNTGTCFECGEPGHFKKNCPKLKNNGADRSFISTAFSALLNIAPTALDNHYDVELADGKIIGVNTILRGCTLDFLNHSFNIDLMPVPLGSFDVIIGMDWLREYHVVIICDEKIVRVSFINETLIFQGKRNDQDALWALRISSDAFWFDKRTGGIYGLHESGKANVFVDALSRKERSRPLRVQALVTTMGLNLPKKILGAQTEALKPKNLSAEDVRGMIRKDLPKEKLEPRTDGTLYMNNRSWTDDQNERTIQTLEDMLRACVIDFGKSWDRYLPLVEFSYNNSYHASIKAAPFEALYGRKCCSPFCWVEVGDVQLTGPEIVHETTKKIVQIKSRIQATRDRKKRYADLKLKPMDFQVSDRVMLKVSPWKAVVHFNKRGKLNPRYVRPFKVLSKVRDVSYRLELPQQLS